MNEVEIKKSMSGTEILKTRSSILSKHSSLSRLESLQPPVKEISPALFEIKREDSTLNLVRDESTQSPAAREPRYKDKSTESGRKTRNEGELRRSGNMSNIDMDSGQTPKRTVKSSLRISKSRLATGKCSQDRREAFTMTETATSVEVLNPRFGNISA